MITRRLLLLFLGGVLLAALMPKGTTAQEQPTIGQSPNEEYIVGGEPATPGEFPWQAMLLKGSQQRFWCGGSLIAPQWVLTAAHCLGDIQFVVLGAHRYGSTSSEAERQMIAVKQEIRHPGYGSNSNLGYDIGLIELRAPATLNQRVQLLPLAIPGQDDYLLVAGQSTTVTGWGATSEHGSDPTVLQKVTVPIVDRTICNDAYGGDILADMICAGVMAGGQDSCYGDSGGPLIAATGSDGWKQIGIVSWGNGCARRGYPGVYTSVPFFADWIASILPSVSPTATPVPSATPTATPTPVPTTTPTPTVVPNPVKNGDFEAGDNGDWQQRSAHEYQLIDNQIPVHAHSGEYSGWLGGIENEKGRLKQRVFLSINSAPILRYYYRIEPNGQCGGNLAKIFVNRDRLLSYTLCGSDDSGRWQQELIDLRAYAGQTVNLQFFAKTKHNNRSDFFVDDVAVLELNLVKDTTAIRTPEGVEDVDSLDEDETPDGSGTPIEQENILFLPFVQR